MSPVKPATTWRISVTCPCCGGPLHQTATQEIDAHVLRNTVACTGDDCSYQGQLTVTLCAVPPSRRQAVDL